MKIKLTKSSLSLIKVTGKAYWITDEGYENLRLYVGASGKKTWYASFWKDGKKQSYKLGAANVLTVTEAQDAARKFFARLTLGEVPEKKAKKKLRFIDFIENEYKPWVVEHRKTGEETIYIFHSAFKFLLEKPVEEITTKEIEKWRTKRRENGIKAATINRQTAVLKAALNWGVNQGIIEPNPLIRLKRLPEHDSEEKDRYLTPDEKKRLMAALDEREARKRTERNSHNKWLSERGKEMFPSLEGEFVDYLKPLVLLAMNSGIRRGNLFSLKWGDVDFTTKTITLRAATTKAGKVLRLPLNQTVIDTLTTWRKQSENTSSETLVFPSLKKKGALLVDIKRSWEGVLKAAKIENFRWHDLRHDFASQLVMKGVDLNTVRELLGHADMKMTQRYAHLAPESKLRAVELLDTEK